MTKQQKLGACVGGVFGVCVLALGFDDAIVRYTVPALSLAPQIVPETLAALLNVGAQAANDT